MLFSREASLESPLVPERIRPGDNTHNAVFDRYHAWYADRDDEMSSPTYNQPEHYHIYGRTGQTLKVHVSRIQRFDGISPLTANSWSATYEYDWGVSTIVRALRAISQDESIAAGSAQLVKEASVFVLKTQGFRDTIMGRALEGDPTPEQLGRAVTQLKSIYRTLFLDVSDEAERLSVNFGGLGDVFDRHARRLAAIAQIPMTRFWGTSPIGMNATGEGDNVNYAQTVLALQESGLSPVLDMWLDPLLARHAGVGTVPEYRWLPLVEMSEVASAEASRTRAEAIQIAIDSGIMDADEGREALAGDPIFGELEGDAPEMEPPPEPTQPMPGDPNANPDA